MVIRCGIETAEVIVGRMKKGNYINRHRHYNRRETNHPETTLEEREKIKL